MARANLVAWERQAPHLQAILEHHGRVDNVLFRPDGRAILTGSTDGTARLWDAATGQPSGPPLVHGEQVSAIAFAPEGRLVLTGGSEVRIWDPVTGQPAGPPFSHGEPIQNLAFSPDGRLVMICRKNLDARLWNAATGAPVGPPFGTAVKDAHFSPDGRSFRGHRRCRRLGRGSGTSPPEGSPARPSNMIPASSPVFRPTAA